MSKVFPPVLIDKNLSCCCNQSFCGVPCLPVLLECFGVCFISFMFHIFAGEQRLSNFFTTGTSFPCHLISEESRSVADTFGAYFVTSAQVTRASSVGFPL